MNPSVLVVEDDPTLNRLLVKELRKAGYELDSASSWQEARERIAAFAPNLVLLDVNLPDATGFGPLSEIAGTRPVVMLTAYGSVHQAVEAMRLGAADYLVKPVNLDELELVIRGALERSRLQAQSALARGDAGLAMIGESAAMQMLRQTIREVGASDVTVLIQGESGSGKELVAQALHSASRRRGESFVAVDCCTLQEALFESELFGHERGAFTGADRRKAGLIEAAAHGTLFLDEIGEAGPAIQAKLLRVLETGRFRHVGATTDLRSDARIVAATNRNLQQRSRDGQFREDLYYRLSAFVIQVPPLRDRRDDIDLLAAHFIASRRQAQGLSPAWLMPDALARLVAYDWPGNVRELRNVIERALILGEEKGVIEGRDLASEAAGTTEDGRVVLAGGLATLPLREARELFEREYLMTQINRFGGNISRTASFVGMERSALHRKLKSLGVNTAALSGGRSGRDD